jgi:hypothetical protein
MVRHSYGGSLCIAVHVYCRHVPHAPWSVPHRATMQTSALHRREPARSPQIAKTLSGPARSIFQRRHSFGGSQVIPLRRRLSDYMEKGMDEAESVGQPPHMSWAPGSATPPSGKRLSLPTVRSDSYVTVAGLNLGLMTRV